MMYQHNAEQFRLRKVMIERDGQWYSNEYECADCKRDGREHKIVNEPEGFTDDRSCWGSGIPTTKYRCTCCNREDGPWVSADIVGGGW